MTIPKKSTQVANICKPNLLPVTFSFIYKLSTLGKNPGNPLESMKAASPSPDPQEPVFPPLNLQNSGSFNLKRLKIWGRKGESESKQVFGVKNPKKKPSAVFSLALRSWDGFFSNVSEFFQHPKTLPPSICSGSGRAHRLLLRLERLERGVKHTTHEVEKGSAVRTGDTQDACCINEIIINCLFVMSYLLDSTRSHKEHAACIFAHMLSTNIINTSLQHVPAKC